MKPQSSVYIGNANFIKSDAPFVREYDREKSPCFIFRRRFEVKNISAARVSVCGLGYAYYYINGEKITPDLLTAPVSDYNKTLWYNVYDVTEFLREGENVFTVICGNGFFNEPFQTSWDHNKVAWRDNPKFILLLEAGGKVILTSDAKWKCAPYSPIVFNHLRSGEHFDSRLYDPDFNKLSYNDSDWNYAVTDNNPPKGVFRECKCAPIRECAEYKTVNMVKTGPKKYVFDIGQNISGVIRLKIKQNSGDSFVIRYAEQVYDDYSLNLNNMQIHYPESEFMTDKFICNGEEFIWQPMFVYHGFRYIEIDGINDPHPDTVTGIFVHQDIKAVSGFECSDDLLNRLFKAGQMATWSNLFYMPTDCPTREKLGWANDAQASAEQMLINFDIANLFRKWNTDIIDAMTENGAMPGIIPTSGWGFKWGNGPVSDGVLFELPYKLYLYTGDKSLLVNNLPYFERYLRYLATRREPDGMVGFGLADHAPPEDTKTPAKLINTALISEFLRIAKLAAAFAGNSGLKEKYTAEYEKTKKLFIENFISVNGACTIDEQTAVSMTIYYKLCNEIEPLKAQLKRLVEERDFHHNCGMVGLRRLYIALNACGLAEYAYKIITAKGYPSYSQWLEGGATTLWETWQPGASKNHHMYSDFMSWIMKTLVGINIDENAPAYEKVTVSPVFVRGLDFCRGYTETPKGRIEAAWKREGETITLEITVPKNITALCPYGVLSEGENIINIKTEP